MDVYPNDLVPKDDAADVSETWALAYFLIANWREQVSVRTSWSTNVVAAQTVRETRQQMVGRPYRSVEAILTTMHRGESQDLQAVFARFATAQNLWPLYSDFTTLSAPYAAGTALSCDTRWRRFFVGQRVAVVDTSTLFGGKVSAARVDVATVTAIAAGGLTISGALSGPFPRGRVYPLIETRLAPEHAAALLSDVVTETTVDVAEVTGRSALPPLAEPGSLPTGFPTVTGPGDLEAPVLTLAGSWDSMTEGLTRVATMHQSRLSVIPQTWGTRPRVTGELSFAFDSREKAWDLLRFFDSRAGRAYPFWMVSPVSHYTPLSVGSSIVVKARGSTYDYGFRPYIALVLRDGTHMIRAVNGVTRLAGEDTLNLSASFGAIALSQIRRCAPAHLVRFDSDELAEAWATNQLMTTALPVVELFAENPISLGVETLPEVLGTDPVDIGGGGDPPPGGGPKLYKQARACVGGGLVDLWIPVSDIDGYPFTFINPADGLYYHVNEAEPSVELEDAGTVPPGWERVPGACPGLGGGEDGSCRMTYNVVIANAPEGFGPAWNASFPVTWSAPDGVWLSAPGLPDGSGTGSITLNANGCSIVFGTGTNIDVAPPVAPAPGQVCPTPGGPWVLQPFGYSGSADDWHPGGPGTVHIEEA